MVLQKLDGSRETLVEFIYCSYHLIIPKALSESVFYKAKKVSNVSNKMYGLY